MVDRRNYHLFQPLLYQVAIPIAREALVQVAGDANDYRAPLFATSRSKSSTRPLSVGAHGTSRCASQPIRSRKILRTRFGS